MKKVFSTIVAALVAVSFAGIAFAAEPAKTEAPAVPATQAAPAKPEVKKAEGNKCDVLKRHHKKHHKKHHMKHMNAKPAPKPEAAVPAPPAPPAVK